MKWIGSLIEKIKKKVNIERHKIHLYKCYKNDTLKVENNTKQLKCWYGIRNRCIRKKGKKRCYVPFKIQACLPSRRRTDNTTYIDASEATSFSSLVLSSYTTISLLLRFL